MIASADTTYYVSKVFWLIAAPTNALVLIGAIAALWAVMRRSNYMTWLAAAVACGLVIETFTPIGLALTVPLETRFRALTARFASLPRRHHPSRRRRHRPD